MSALHFLPRLVSWSNLYKTKIPHDQELLTLTLKLENEKERPGKFRRKISYWSDEEMNNYYHHKQLSPHAIDNRNIIEPEFVTKWRPQTTFGYSNDDFDIKRHQRNTLSKFEFKSKPTILRR